MTTIVVHGTLATLSKWFWDSWNRVVFVMPSRQALSRPGIPGPRLKDRNPSQSSRTDRDPQTKGLHTELKLPVNKKCKGTAAYTVLHIDVTGWICGQWIAGQSIKNIRHGMGGDFPLIACDDGE